MMYIHFIGGLVILLVGGELLVRGAVALAQRLAVSPLLIGLTVVAVGTSAPELVVSIDASLRNATALAIGNIVGSNIANIVLVLGLPALLRPIACNTRSVGLDNFVMIISTLIFILFCQGKEIGHWQGIVLISSLVAYLFWRYWSNRGDIEQNKHYSNEVTGIVPNQWSFWRSTIFVLAGLIGLVVGAEMLIGGAVDIARIMGISEAIIGLTLVAIGTSLPELVAVTVSVMRGHSDLAIGNVIGSNMFNIMGVIGTTAIIVPLPVPPELLQVDLWIMLVTTLLLTPILIRRMPINAPIGVGFLLIYAGFIMAQFYVGHSAG